MQVLRDATEQLSATVAARDQALAYESQSAAAAAQETVGLRAQAQQMEEELAAREKVCVCVSV